MHMLGFREEREGGGTKIYHVIEGTCIFQSIILIRHTLFFLKEDRTPQISQLIQLYNSHALLRNSYRCQ